MPLFLSLFSGAGPVPFQHHSHGAGTVGQQFGIDAGRLGTGQPVADQGGNLQLPGGHQVEEEFGVARPGPRRVRGLVYGMGGVVGADDGVAGGVAQIVEVEERRGADADHARVVSL